MDDDAAVAPIYHERVEYLRYTYIGCMFFRFFMFFPVTILISLCIVMIANRIISFIDFYTNIVFTVWLLLNTILIIMITIVIVLNYQHVEYVIRSRSRKLRKILYMIGGSLFIERVFD